MSKLNLYGLEEYHNGRWQPVTNQVDGKPVARTVKITKETAAVMNIDKKHVKLRYKKIKAVKDTNVKGTGTGNSDKDNKLTPMAAAKLRKEVILKLDSVEKVKAALDGETAKSVITAGKQRIEELNK